MCWTVHYPGGEMERQKPSKEQKRGRGKKGGFFLSRGGRVVELSQDEEEGTGQKKKKLPMGWCAKGGSRVGQAIEGGLKGSAV